MLNRIASPIVGILIGMAAVSAQAQSSYFQTVTNLNPVGYWPMQETNAPAAGNIETNLGSLGALANAYYLDGQGTNPITRGFPGALAGDTDTGLHFSGLASCYLAAPSIKSNLALGTNFTIELWAWPTNTTFGMVVGKSGFEGLNGNGNPGAGTGSPTGGWTVDWHRSTAIWDLQIFHGGVNTADQVLVNGTTAAASTTNWQHLVFTYDGTTVTFYWNGQLISTHATAFVPDTWNPLTIGAGRIVDNALGDAGGHRFFGNVDDVALYSNVLSANDVLAHYQAGTNAAPAESYEQLVMGDNPLVYYRLDARPYSAPPTNTYPVLNNFGSQPLAGTYPPNTIPGGDSGPPFFGFGPSNFASPINGLDAAVDVPYASVLNQPTGQPVSAMVWVRGYPTDTRFQNVMGRGDSSWRISWDGSGKAHWNAGAGGEITSQKLVNDGGWHFLAGVYTGTANLLYIDGVLDSTNAATGAITGNTNDLFLGGAPDYITAANERYFSGSICQAAFFTNALTGSQISQIYGSAGIPPAISQQPISVTANQGGNYTNTVIAAGSPPLIYQWYQNSIAVPGQTNASLIYDPLQGGEAGSYYVVVSNDYGSVTSSVVALTVIQTPEFTLDLIDSTHTNNIVLFAGAQPTFTVAAVGAVPLTYQWFANDAVISGATNSTYTFPPLSIGSLSSFDCVISNSLGVTTSTVINVTVEGDPAAPYPAAVVSDAPMGFWRLDESPDNGNGNNGTIANDYLGGHNGVYSNTALQQPSYSQASDPNETSAGFGLLAFADCDAFGIQGVDFASPAGTSKSFSIEVWVNGQMQVSDAGIVNKGYSGAEQFNLDTGADGGTPTHDFRFFVRDAAGVVHSAASTVNPNNPFDVWHHLVGVCDETNGLVALYIDGVLSASATITPGAGILPSTNLMVIGARKSSATTNVNDWEFIGDEAEVAVYNYALSASQVNAHYYASGLAPVITKNLPGGTNVDENGTVSFGVTAIGTQPLTYQWYGDETGQPLPNQTNATLVLSNFSLAMNGSGFYVAVANPYGTINSGNITVSVNSGAPQLSGVVLPPNIYVYSNSVYTYPSVHPAGTEPFTYQWLNGSTPISGATNSSYALTAMANTTIYVVVSNADGSTTSNPSAVTILTPPANALSHAILALNPIGYWPMQETTAPATANVETNLGSLGASENAYYLDTTTSPISRGVTGALSGDSDPGVNFSGANNAYLAAPQINPAIALVPPFTVELWAWPANTTFGMPLAKNGFEGLNAGGDVGAGTGNLCGWSVDWARNGNTAWDFQLYDNLPAQGAAIQIFGPTSAGSTTGWQHVVFTYDGSTINFYWNGQFITNGAAPYVPDLWSPLCIGAGRLAQGTPGDLGYRIYVGQEDEVAMYTNILSAEDIQAHYQAGTSASPTTPYKQLVLNDHPLVYYRMDAPTYNAPAAATYPALINYGSVPTTGDYPPNTIPGFVAGPTNFGPLVASPINGFNAAVDAGNAAQFDTTNGQAITAMVWAKGYPSDGRLQSPMSHGDQSWHFGWDTAGKAHWSSGNNGGEITSVKTVNDDNWHLLTGVYTGTQNLLYIDGALDSSSTPAGTITGSTDDIFLGGSPDNVAPSIEQFFSGSICQAAFFTNALTASQINQIYTAGAVTLPTISLSRANGNIVITYTGVLQSSADANGTFTAVSGASSPYTPPLTGARQFYRASAQ